MYSLKENILKAFYKFAAILVISEISFVESS